MKFKIIMPGDDAPFDGELDLGSAPTPGDHVTVGGKFFVVVGVKTRVGNTDRPWDGEIRLAPIQIPTIN